MAYCLRITDLDPIKYDLLFERFLNPSRISMPDIDMDFDSRYRDEMIRYAAERYGRDHVAQIVTFSTIKARAAVRDAARVLGYPYVVGDKVAKAMPPLIMGRDTPLHACLEQHPKFEDGYKMAAELRDMYATDPDAKAVIDVAKGLEGLRRQDGIHAAAVVITKEPLTEYLPIQRKPESGQAPEDAPGRHPVRDARRRGAGPAQDGLPGPAQPRRHHRHAGADPGRPGASTSTSTTSPSTTPPPTSCCAGATPSACSSWRAAPMRALIRSLAPTELRGRRRPRRPVPARARWAANMHNDYADRKNGRKPVEYLHPDAEEVLGDTYGLMIYQESMMRVAQKFAGYSLAEADNLRKACGKKIRELIGQGAGQVRRRLRGHGLRRGPRARSCSTSSSRSPTTPSTRATRYGYGFIAYQTAYLKANYPVEYLAACSPASRPAWTRPPSTWPSAGPWASRCSSPTSTGPRRTSPPVTDPDGRAGSSRSSSGSPRCATWARAWSS